MKSPVRYENNPIRDLEQIALPLIAGPDSIEAREAVESVRDLGKREMMEGIIGQFSIVASYAEWDESRLLRQVGDVQTEVFNSSPDLSTDQLENSRDFLRLLTELSWRKATKPLIRDSLMSLGFITKCTDLSSKDLNELLDIPDRLLPRVSLMSPREYFEIGECYQAEQTALVAALRNFDNIPALAAAVSRNSLYNLFRHSPYIHISTPRIDSYVKGEVDIFGEDVFKAVHEHVTQCKACREVADYRFTKLVPSSSDQPQAIERNQGLVAAFSS